MNAAVMACVACKDIDRALALYDEMVKPDGCGVDNVTYGSLLKVSSLCGQLKIVGYARLIVEGCVEVCLRINSYSWTVGDGS